MQGKKDFIPKVIYQVHPDDLVPQDNFYRLLDKELNLRLQRKRKNRWNNVKFGKKNEAPTIRVQIVKMQNF